MINLVLKSLQETFNNNKIIVNKRLSNVKQINIGPSTDFDFNNSLLPILNISCMDVNSKMTGNYFEFSYEIGILYIISVINNKNNSEIDGAKYIAKSRLTIFDVVMGVDEVNGCYKIGEDTILGILNKLPGKTINYNNNQLGFINNIKIDTNYTINNDKVGALITLQVISKCK